MRVVDASADTPYTTAYFQTKPNNAYYAQFYVAVQKGGLTPTKAAMYVISAVIRTDAAGAVTIADQATTAQETDHAGWAAVIAVDGTKIDVNLTTDDSDTTWVRTWAEIVLIGEGGIHEYGDAANA
jgi:hypothetical protein